MAVVHKPNKTKIARRVIEVFEYFDEEHPTATVMDIVRRYDRPQSSTSELMSNLVRLGMLYKDPRSRSYWPTPRLAALGANVRPLNTQYAPLFSFMDNLAHSARQSLALFGIVGTQVQIFHWSPAPNLDEPYIHRGSSELLSANVAGHLLLSTMEGDELARFLRRLHVETPPARQFNVAELNAKISRYRQQRNATGESGFLPGYSLTATLLPSAGRDRPLALGLFHPELARVDIRALLRTLERGIKAFTADNAREMPAPPFIVAA
jgi:DNA-binding IclR family transcriptional regulator